MVDLMSYSTVLQTGPQSPSKTTPPPAALETPDVPGLSACEKYSGATLAVYGFTEKLTKLTMHVWNFPCDHFTPEWKPKPKEVTNLTMSIGQLSLCSPTGS